MPQKYTMPPVEVEEIEIGEKRGRSLVEKNNSQYEQLKPELSERRCHTAARPIKDWPLSSRISAKAGDQTSAANT